MLRRSYDWTMRLAAHRRALPILGLIAFIESSFFPIPPDAMLVPMVLAKPKHWFRIASVCTLASVAGGVFGYLIGMFLYDTLGVILVDFYNLSDEIHDFSSLYNEWGGWIVFGAGLTPFPYKMITIASGLSNLDLLLFITASIGGRGLRFFLLAGILSWFGPIIQATLDRYISALTILIFILLISSVIVIKYWL